MARLGWYPVRESTRRAPSARDLDDLGARLGGDLPSDYRHFVKHYGLGAVRDKWFPIQDECPWGQWGIADVFLGFSTNQRDGIDAAAFDIFAGEIPKGTLPIAYDPGGNLLLLATGGAKEPAGSVWFWDHEHREQSAADSESWKSAGRRTESNDNLYAVAGSFTAFLQSLRAEPSVRQRSEA